MRGGGGRPQFIPYALYDFDGMEPGELDMVPEIDEHELQKLPNHSPKPTTSGTP